MVTKYLLPSDLISMFLNVYTCGESISLGGDILIY